MYKNKRILAIIPARGGSKGIPHKNIIEICGKPLIAYTIGAAKESKYIDEIIVSTDDNKIKEVSENFGAKVPFLRPGYLSNDKAKSIDVVIHAIEYLRKVKMLEYDYIVLLQPTSPLRTANDIDSGIIKLIENKGNSLISVCKAEENPVLMRTINNSKLHKIIKFEGKNLRRQSLPEFYVFNGALYINSVNMLLSEKCFVNEDTLPYIMEKEKSVDIDNLLDLKLAEILLREKKDV